MGAANRDSLSDYDFAKLFNELGPTELAKRLGISKRNVLARRTTIEKHTGIPIVSKPHYNSTREAVVHSARKTFDVKNGTVIVGSDAHIWPGYRSTGMRAFTKFAKEIYDLAGVILNGDVLDFPQISRHPPIGHQSLPDVQDEVEEAQDQLHGIELAVKRSTKLIWTLGNHDARFETRLATVAPEFAKLHGHSLKNHFPAWEPCWSCWINDDVVVKHRWKGGIHATHNNTIGAGKTMVTSHLHSAKVTPYSDYNGTRYGVDTGCLADPNAKQFVDYTEDGPKNWRQGFVVLTFQGNQLLLPELVLVWDQNTVQFRGKLIKV